MVSNWNGTELFVKQITKKKSFFQPRYTIKKYFEINKIKLFFRAIWQTMLSGFE
jgi:hypothetical protein